MDVAELSRNNYSQDEQVLHPPVLLEFLADSICRNTWDLSFIEEIKKGPYSLLRFGLTKNLRPSCFSTMSSLAGSSRTR
jgi:hypothetical protein